MVFQPCGLRGWGGTHLYFQLLYHLHLDSTLGRASVVKCMFCIEVSGEKNTGVDAWTCPKCAPSTRATPGISPDLQTACAAATLGDAGAGDALGLLPKA